MGLATKSSYTCSICLVDFMVGQRCCGCNAALFPDTERDTELDLDAAYLFLERVGINARPDIAGYLVDHVLPVLIKMNKNGGDAGVPEVRVQPASP